MPTKLETFLASAITAHNKKNSAHLGDRTQYIGASDIAGCPRKAVLARQSPVAHTVTTQLRFAWGHLSQELFSRLFESGGLRFDEEVEIIHPQNPRIRCHIDFLFKGKNDRFHIVEKKATGNIPSEPHQSWIDQLQFQMGMFKHFHPDGAGSIIAGSVLAAKPLPKETGTVLVDGVKEYTPYEPNDLIFAHLMKKAGHILAAIDGKEEARCEPSFICGKCPYHSDCPAHRLPNFAPPEDVQKASKRFLELKAQEKALKAEMDTLQEQLLGFTGGSYQGSYDGVSIKAYTVKDSTTVDSKKLAQNYPEAFKACSKPKKGGVRLEVSEVKKTADADGQLKLAA
jgi:hypothetical protein